MLKLSIIIPAYNEQKRIGKTLEAYSLFFNQLVKEGKLDYEILVVINNTKDKTEEIVKKAQLKNKKIHYLNFKRGGKGFAIIEGFKDALKRHNDLIGFVDADMSTSPHEYSKLAMSINNFDGIIASRWKKNSVVYPKQNFIRKSYSFFFNLLVRVILGLKFHDTQCGAKIFTKESIEKVVDQIGVTQWAFDIDLLYKMKKNGFNVVETCTKWSDREKSNVHPVRTPIQMFFSVIRLRLLNSPFKLIIGVYDSLPQGIKIHKKI